MTLDWDANPEPSIAGYRLYYGTSTGNYSQSFDVGNQITATVSNLVVGPTYFFAVTAYDADGFESFPSDEVSFESNRNQPPALINALQRLPNGPFLLTVTSQRNVAVEGIDVQVSSDLKTWTLLRHFAVLSGTNFVIDPAADGASERYYRLLIK